MKENVAILKAGYNLGMANLMLKDVIGRLETIMEDKKDKSDNEQYQSVINQILSATLFIEKTME
jgi:hypothetical protein